MAHRRGSGLLFDSRYSPEDQPSLGTASLDWAILELEAPIDVAPLPMSGVVPVGAPLLRAGYSQDRAHMLSVDRRCQVGEPLPNSVLIVHDCDGTLGDSGSPLLEETAAGLSIDGIHVGTEVVAGRSFNDIGRAHV